MSSGLVPDVTDDEIQTLLPLLSARCRSQLTELPERQRRRLLTQLREYLDRDAASQPTKKGKPADRKDAEDEPDDDDEEAVEEDTKSGSVKVSSSAKSFVMLLEKRVELEIESAKRRKVLAAKLRQDDAWSRRIALFFTLAIAASAVFLATYLSEGRRMYRVVDFVMRWYHWLTSSGSSGNGGTFVVDGEEFDLYS